MDIKYREWGINQLAKIADLKAEKGLKPTDRISIAECGPDDYCNPYGCVGWADPCGDGDIISLSLCGGSKLLDVLDWRPTTVCRDVRQYITWIGGEEMAGMNLCEMAEQSGIPTAPCGIIEDCCAPRPGVAWGGCKYEVDGFALIGRSGGVQCIYDDGLKPCETSPMFRFNGQRITSNFEWRSVLSAQVIMQDVNWMVFWGDRRVQGQVDGLNNLIGTGLADYHGNRCSALDGITITWKGGCYATEGGTWEDGRTADCGAPISIPAGTSVIDLLKWIRRNINARIRMTGNLRGQSVGAGDQALVVNSNMAQCLLDCMVCYRMCDPATPNVMVFINNADSQTFRDSLLGGFFGDGQLRLDGGYLSLLVDDTLPDNVAYFLTFRVGSQRMIQGEYQDMGSIDRSSFGDTYMPSDGNRFMNFKSTKEACIKHTVDHRMRLTVPGSFAQAKIVFEDFMGDCVPVKIPSCNINSQAFVSPLLNPALCTPVNMAA